MNRKFIMLLTVGLTCSSLVMGESRQAIQAPGLFVSRMTPRQTAASRPTTTSHHLQAPLRLTDGTTLYGNMLYSEQWEESSDYGVYAIQNTLFTPLSTGYEYRATGGALYDDGKYIVLRAVDYGEGPEAVEYYEFETEYWSQTDEDELPANYMATDFATDPITGTVYGACASYDYEQELAIVDFGNRHRQTVGQLSTSMIALAHNGNALYGISSNGDLYRISTEDASLTRIGSTGYRPAYLQSATFDLATGHLYWACATTSDMGLLLDVNIYTGEASRVCYFPGNEEFVGLYCLNEMQDNGAPNAPSDILISYADGQISLSWQAPTTTLMGAPLGEGSLTYRVTRLTDGQVIAPATSANTLTDAVDGETLAVYQYAVTAMLDGMEGGTANSERIVVGEAITPPFTDDFSTDANWMLYTTLDNDGDGYSWQYGSQHKAALLPGQPFDETNDWLVSPKLRLQANQLYRVKASFSSEWAGNYPYRAAICLGTEANANSLTTVICATDRINDPAVQQLDAYLQVPTDGLYYLAYHVWGYDLMSILLDDICILEGPLANAPAQVTELSILPDAAGLSKVDISCIAPVLAIDGSTLTEPMTVSIMREGEVIATFTEVAPGQSVTFTDTEAPSCRNVTYSVTATNATGQGLPAECTVWVGSDEPTVPLNIRAKMTGDEITLSWDAPTVGQHGGPLKPESLTYNITRMLGNDYQPVGTTSSTSYTETIEQTGEQQWLTYVLVAKNDLGSSEFAISNSLIAGAPYELPFSESFADGQRHSFWGQEQYDDNGWGSSWFVGNSESYDADGGFMSFQGASENSGARIISGKIDLRGAANPILEYAYYLRSEYYDDLGEPMRVCVIVEGRDTVVVDTQEAVYFWQSKPFEPASVSLADFKDAAYIQIAFDIRAASTTFAGIDAICVRDLYDHDLTLTLEAPASASAGKEAEVKVLVKNIGANAASNYTVRLYADDKLVGEELCESVLEVNAASEVSFALPVGNLSEEIALLAEVDYALDQALNNNQAEATVNVMRSDYPTPQDLSATADGYLQWYEPAYADYTLPSMQNAETLAAGTISDFGPWTVVDADQKPTISYLEVDWEPIQYPHMGEAMAWTVINPAAFGIPTTSWWGDDNGWGAPEGEQYFMSVCTKDGEADDWLISDLLTGEAQTISFLQRGYYGYESYEVLYSTTDAKPESFTALCHENTASYNWASVSVNLPEGALYFAIRNMGGSWAQYMLVDDIHYQSQASKGGLQLLGYRIYRDREFVAETEETTFVDEQAIAGSHTYDVTALYNLGESCPATVTTDITTGIHHINADQSIIRYSIDGRRMSHEAQGFGIAIDAAGHVSKQMR